MRVFHIAARAALSLSLLGLSTASWAQITFVPAAAPGPEQVPVFSPVMLAVTVLVALFIGFKYLRSKGSSAVMMVLLATGGMGVAGGALWVESTEAGIANFFQITSSSGGTFPINPSDNQYTNESGVTMQISTINTPENCASLEPINLSTPLCEQGDTLADGAACGIFCSVETSEN